jgi:hypothetical protein
MAGGFHSINDAFDSYLPSERQKLLFFPFSTAGLAALPNNWRDLLNLLEFIYAIGAGTYTAAIDRAIALVITPIQIKDAENRGSLNRQTKLKIQDDLNDILGYGQQLNKAAIDFLLYGNVFISIYQPFLRSMMCPSCRKEHNLEYMLLPENKELYNAKFNISTLEIPKNGKLPAMGNFTCPDCKYTGRFGVIDRHLKNRHDVQLRFWRPQDILIESGSFDNNHNIYHLVLNQQDKRSIESGSPVALTTFPLELLSCAKPNCKTFRFAKNAIYHMKDTTPSGIQTCGWGIPRPLRHFQLLWQLCALHKINEAISSDYSIPKRVVTPAPVKGSTTNIISDISGHTDMAPLLARVQKMFNSNEIGNVEFLPMPIQYQLLGGEAKQLVPDVLLQQAEERLLNAMHVPVELYRLSLTAQATKISLKLIDTVWSPLRWELNKFLQWVRDSLSVLYKWTPVKLTMESLQLNYDSEDQVLLIQSAGQGDISKTDAYAPMGFDYIDQQTTIYDEQKQIQENQMQLSDYMTVIQNAKNLAISQNPQTFGGQQSSPNAAGGGEQVASGGSGAPAQMPASGSQQLAQMAQQALQGAMNNMDYTKMNPVEQNEFARQIAQQVSMMQPGTPERRQTLNQLRSSLPETLYDAIYRQIEKTDHSMNQQGGMVQRQQGQ